MYSNLKIKITFLAISVLSVHSMLAQVKPKSTNADQSSKEWGFFGLDLMGSAGDGIAMMNMFPAMEKKSLGNHASDGFTTRGNSKGQVTDLSREKNHVLGKISEESQGKKYMVLAAAGHSGYNSKGETAMSLPMANISGIKQERTVNAAGKVEYKNVPDFENKFSRFPAGRTAPGETLNGFLKDSNNNVVSRTNGPQTPIPTSSATNSDIKSQHMTTSELLGAANSKTNQGIICIVDSCFAGGMIDAIKKDPHLKDKPIILIGSASATEASFGGSPEIRDKNGNVVKNADGMLSGLSSDLINNRPKHDTNSDGKISFDEVMAAVPKSVKVNPEQWDPAAKKWGPAMEKEKDPISGRETGRVVPQQNTTQSPFVYEQGDPQKLAEMKKLDIFTKDQEVKVLEQEPNGSVKMAKTHVK